jgi:hypothetical protein
LRRLGIAVVSALIALSMLGAGSAMAKISAVDTACSNNGGQYPAGQQTTCSNDNGLNQDTENQNPAGKAPPGQN